MHARPVVVRGTDRDQTVTRRRTGRCASVGGHAAPHVSHYRGWREPYRGAALVRADGRKRADAAGRGHGDPRRLYDLHRYDSAAPAWLTGMPKELKGNRETGAGRARAHRRSLRPTYPPWHEPPLRCSRAPSIPALPMHLRVSIAANAPATAIRRPPAASRLSRPDLGADLHRILRRGHRVANCPRVLVDLEVVATLVRLQRRAGWGEGGGG